MAPAGPNAPSPSRRAGKSRGRLIPPTPDKLGARRRRLAPVFTLPLQKKPPDAITISPTHALHKTTSRERSEREEKEKKEMPRPKRQLHATVEETLTPPAALSPSQSIARVTKAEGKNLYSVELPSGRTVLAELEAKFRSTIWIKRGSYVVVDNGALAERDNKLEGEIVNVVRDEKAWRKMGYWYV